MGPTGTIMFDAHCCRSAADADPVRRAIEPYDVLFIEEPAVPGNIEVFKRLKEAIRVPLATGERDRTIWGVMPYLQERCIDILQPDCGHTGGITQMKKIAALAETFFVPLAPHCTMSELGLSASLHATATVPLFLIHEGYLDGHLMPRGRRPQELGGRRRRLRLAAAGAGLGGRDRRSGDRKGQCRPEARLQMAHPRTTPTVRSAIIDARPAGLCAVRGYHPQYSRGVREMLRTMQSGQCAIRA